jgi:hypothetical protein
MLAFLRSIGEPSDRKSRLFAVACCRRVWRRMTDERSRHAVEVCEHHADGRAGQKVLREARRAAFAATKEESAASARHAALVALHACSDMRRDGRPSTVAASTADCASSLVFFSLGDEAGWAERKAHCDCLCEMFGNPFRPLAFAPEILRWNDGTVSNLAQAIYEELRFADLPVLADALEEAGCTNPEILGHCRGSGPHVLGCWAVDLLLGRE